MAARNEARGGTAVRLTAPAEDRGFSEGFSAFRRLFLRQIPMPLVATGFFRGPEVRRVVR